MLLQVTSFWVGYGVPFKVFPYHMLYVEDGLCINMKPLLGALSLELKV
jgi:hypothetical protein